MNYNRSIACLNNDERKKNLCIFQGLQPPEFMNCGGYTPPCSDDKSNVDGTFICSYHLARYFKIKKEVFEIPSGVNNTSFKYLVGVSLIQQDTPEAYRITIPSKENYYSYLNVANMSSMEKYVFYTIYDEPDTVATQRVDINQAPTGTRLSTGEYEGPIRALCSSLSSQEFYTEDVLSDLSSIVTSLMGAIKPSIICRPTREETLRTFGDQNPESQTAFDAMPNFIKNLIMRLVRPVVLQIGNTELILDQNATCSIVPGKGLIPVKLYNPEKPKFTYIPQREPKFQVYNFVDFGGRATREQQEALNGYDRYVISRPLLLGREQMAQVY
ncbi:P39 capsid [Pseudalatia unipuncta granulovirus]|uniref:P39 capsid n=1 Tax=Pseudalatia unipuncta granulosis virus TaxID=36355 RepID=B6S6Y4_GVPU|nr:P39 capsid [Pseudalatia unipuncta granulovirus]ACH69465.1 P39 capsid [Pseudalatia unipuncta granulovirus]